MADTVVTPAPSEHILTKSPAWWQVLLTVIGLLISGIALYARHESDLAVQQHTTSDLVSTVRDLRSSVETLNERVHVTEYQNQISISDRAELHSEQKQDHDMMCQYFMDFKAQLARIEAQTRH